MFHLLVYCLNAHGWLGLGQAQVRSPNLSVGLHVRPSGTQVLATSFAVCWDALLLEAEVEAEEPGLRLGSSFGHKCSEQPLSLLCSTPTPDIFF